MLRSYGLSDERRTSCNINMRDTNGFLYNGVRTRAYGVEVMKYVVIPVKRFDEIFEASLANMELKLRDSTTSAERCVFRTVNYWIHDLKRKLEEAQ